MGSGASKKSVPVERVKTVYLRVNGEVVPVSARGGGVLQVTSRCTLQ